MPLSISLHRPEDLLRWIADGGGQLDLDDLEGVDIWGLVALAALRREPAEPRVGVALGSGGASRFASAVGFRELTNGTPTTTPSEPERTVPLRALDAFPQVEPTAREITRLLLRGEDQREVRRTIHYVIVELLRNVVQHSRASSGGVVAAQVMREGPYARSPAIQVAVADGGVGILASLRSRNPEIASAEEALDKARWPFVSGAFERGLTGSRQNAGMGLFFITEMAKLTASRLLIATRDAGVFVQGDPDDIDRHDERLLRPRGLGFPGTLVVFELPFATAAPDYDGLIRVIADRARARTPARAVDRWFRFDDEPPPDARRLVVSVAAEDTVAAERYSQEVLQPAVLSGRPLALVFTNLPVATQSYLHTLLFEVIRLAWAKRVPIYVAGAGPAVQSSLELLEQYALGG